MLRRKHSSARARARQGGRAAALALAALMVLAATAYAAVGLQNPSFESGLDGWTAQTVADGATDPVPADCAGIGGDSKRAVCVVGADTFTPSGGSPVTVEPLDGASMVRLGGPFTSSGQNQFRDRYQLRQTFTVDPANPVLMLNYNVFVFDYQGFDELRFTVRLTDENGAPITDFAQGGFGSGIALKNTGWRSAAIDLSSYENQQVHLVIDSGGTSDTLYGFWAYVDAGVAPVPPVSPPTFTPPTNPATGQPVPINSYSDGSGQVFIAIPNAQTSDFPGGCVGPIPISVPIAAGSGTVSNVSLLGLDSGPLTMTEGPPGVWNATIDCAQNADLVVQYTLTEGPVSETFIVPIGGIALIDPAGVVYDQARYDSARAAGQSDEQARNGSAIQGAVVRLQRRQGDGSFKNVLSGDPGISPNINPEITGANGQFQWLTDAGDYRVVVAKDGYETTISREVTIPPEVTDLHVGMRPTTQPQPPDADGDGRPDASDQCPNVAAATANGCPAPVIATQTVVPPKACASLTGKKLAKCKRAQALKKAIRHCKATKKKGKKRKICVKRVKALSKCSAIKGKKNADKKKRCVAKAKKIGTKAKQG